MTNTSKYSVVFLALMCALLGGCGPAFTGGGSELDAGAGGDDSGFAGSGSAGTAGSAPTAGAGGSVAGEAGSHAGSTTAGAGGSSGAIATGGSAGTGAQAGTGGAAGATGPSCSPDEAVLDAIQVTDALQLTGYSWTDGLHCAACPEGGCGTCEVVTAYHRALSDTSREVVVTLSCMLELEAGLCGEEVHCTQEPADSLAFSAFVDLTPGDNGYVMALQANRSSTRVASDFYCGPNGGGYGDGNALSNQWLQMFKDLIEGSTLRCEGQ